MIIMQESKYKSYRFVLNITDPDSGKHVIEPYLVKSASLRSNGCGEVQVHVTDEFTFEMIEALDRTEVNVECRVLDEMGDVIGVPTRGDQRQLITQTYAFDYAASDPLIVRFMIV